MRISVITLGCPKNTVDSEYLSGQLVEKNVKFTKRVEMADVVIVNTCAFILPAREEAIETYPELADATTGGPDPYEAHWERCSTPAELAVERQMANPEQDAKELQAVADYWRDQEERGN